MAQQTAVEWLYIKMYTHRGNITMEEYEQAKQMEKEQITKAAKVILYRSTGQGDTAAEQYYNETYGKKA